MALNFLAWEMMVLEERVEQVNRRVQRRILRDVNNPYELPLGEFLKVFRITPELAMQITNTLRPFLVRQRNSALSPEIQVLVTISFYAHGSYQRPTGDRFQFAICPSSVSRCLHAVTDSINEHMLRPWVKFPATRSERQSARLKFINAPQPFEGAIGAIDCTYVNIIAPPDHEEAYVNHHQNHSINVQAIVDPDMKVLNINARYPGARNDAFIWSVSPIRQLMEYHYNRGERRTWLIGDAGYPLEPFLMTPLPNYPVGTRQHQYNEDICKARNIVERFFGVFKGMWRCLSEQRILMYAPAFAGRIINACAVIHNMRIHHRLPVDEDVMVDVVVDQNIVQQNQVNHNEGPRAIAVRVQQQLMLRLYPYLEDGD